MQEVILILHGQFISRESNRTSTVRAAREVILAAGAVRSPQILQLSGVGPRKLLEGLGIECVVDLPGVGRNFQDQPTIYMQFSCKCFFLCEVGGGQC